MAFQFDQRDLMIWRKIIRRRSFLNNFEERIFLERISDRYRRFNDSRKKKMSTSYELSTELESLESEEEILFFCH